MEAHAIIQARYNSNRFPGKVLYDLAGKPVLRHVIDRVRRSNEIESIQVAIAGEHSDAIVGYCDSWGVRWMVGDKSTEWDVLRRFHFAAAMYDEDDLIVRVCGDNPLIVPRCIDELVKVARRVPQTADQRRPDYVGYVFPDGTPAIKKATGYFAEVVKHEALERLDWQMDTTDPRREHVTQGLYEQPEKFECKWIPVPEWYYDDFVEKETAIDTADDLRRVELFLEDQAERWPYK